MAPQVIVLNGGSSAGKSSLAAELQRHLGGTWMTLGVDDLIRAVSHGPEDTTAGGTITFGPDGSVVVAEPFYAAQEAWYAGIAAMARAGARVIIDEVLLRGAAGQADLGRALAGLAVAWVGVRCDPDVAAARELAQGDRGLGMAHDQAERVHDGLSYDLEIDTSRMAPSECAELVIKALRSGT